MKFKKAFLMLTCFSNIMLFSQETNYGEILEGLSVKTVENSYYFSYQVSGSVQIHEQAFEDSPKRTVSTDKLYTIQRYETSLWYICLTDEGDKGYIDLSTVSFIASGIDEHENNLINNSKSFNRYGPLLVYKDGERIKIFEDSIDRDFMEESRCRLTRVEDKFFAVEWSFYESERTILYNYTELNNPIYISGSLVIDEEMGIAWTCSRSFVPPDSLIILDLQNDLILLYMAFIDIGGRTPGFPHPKVTFERDALIIKYEGHEDITVALDEKGVPVSHEALSVIPREIGILNSGQVRIRKRPNLQGEQLGYLQENEKVQIISKTEDMMQIGDMNGYWYKILTENGVYGWAYGYFIDFQK